MKVGISIAVFTLLAGVVRADWKDLKPGMDRQTALTSVGMPLLRNHGKVGLEIWTYDECGYIELQYGRVTYWEAPKPVARRMAEAAALAKANGTVKPVATHSPKSKPLPNTVAVRD